MFPTTYTSNRNNDYSKSVCVYVNDEDKSFIYNCLDFCMFTFTACIIF